MDVNIHQSIPASLAAAVATDPDSDSDPDVVATAAAVCHAGFMTTGAASCVTERLSIHDDEGLQY